MPRKKPAARRTRSPAKKPKPGPADRKSQNAIRLDPRTLPRHPEWDSVCRELRVGNIVVKRFHRPAPWLERLLTEFHEANWEREIDDPLPGGVSPTAARRRLHNTINSLNSCQSPHLVRFGGNGRSDGICWQYNPEFLALDAL